MTRYEWQPPTLETHSARVIRVIRVAVFIIIFGGGIISVSFAIGASAGIGIGIGVVGIGVVIGMASRVFEDGVAGAGAGAVARILHAVVNCTAWCLGKLSRGARRSASWASLIIPAKRREEMEGDLVESIEEATARGFGPFAIFMLKIAKGLLYVWIGLKLRVTDFVSFEKETP